MNDTFKVISWDVPSKHITLYYLEVLSEYPISLTFPIRENYQRLK